MEYAVTGLSINQDIGSALVSVTDIDKQDIKTCKRKKRPSFRP